jgi:hypothetical protein
VSGLFSGELSSDKTPSWEDQNVQAKRVGFTTPSVRRAQRFAGRTGQTSRGLDVGGAESVAGGTRAGAAPALRLAHRPLTAMGRAGQQAADRRGTQGRSHQRQPGLSLWRWELGAANLTAPEPPVDPPPKRKTQKRVLTPFPPRQEPRCVVAPPRPEGAATAIAQGRARRRSRRAPPWVNGQPRTSVALKGQNKRATNAL